MNINPFHPIEIRHISLIGAYMSIILFSCNPSPNQNVAGGPCGYQSDTTPATIIDIYPTNQDSSYFEVVFAVLKFEQPDTLYYSNEFSGYAKKSELDSLKMDIGNKYIYEHRTITSGHCSPDIHSLILKKLD